MGRLCVALRAETSCTFPASPATVACYLGLVYEKEIIHSSSIRPTSRRWARSIVAAGFQIPGQTRLSPQRNFVLLLAARCPPPRTAATFGCSASLYCVTCSPSRAAHQDRRWPPLLGYASVWIPHFSRSTALRNIQRAAVHFDFAEITVQLRVFKYGEGGSAPRVPLIISQSSATDDPIASLLTRF